MTTYYLRFPDEDACKAAFMTIGAYIASSEEFDEKYVSATHNFALDIIGTIYQNGEYDSITGEELSPPIVLDGWHVNYIGELPENCKQYIIFPESPVRKFAGVD